MKSASLMCFRLTLLLSATLLRSDASSLPKNAGLRIKTVAPVVPRGGSTRISGAPQEQRREFPMPWKSRQERRRTPTKLKSTVTAPVAGGVAVPSFKQVINTKTISLTLFSLVSAYLLYSNWAVIMPLLDKDRIQQETLNLLRKLQPDDPVAANALISKPLIMYAAGLAVWELVGLSTIPVESAAGMVFGWKAAIYNALGKVMGAFMAFTLGRYFLASQVTQKLQDNELFQLVNAKPEEQHNGKTPHPPLATAFLMKFSCFPELVKNFGSSLLPVISWWMFALATAVHGGGFSLLWTWLGVDTASRLEGAAAASASSVQGALIVAGVVGVVVTPLLMAWWIRDLKRLSAATHADPEGRVRA